MFPSSVIKAYQEIVQLVFEFHKIRKIMFSPFNLQHQHFIYLDYYIRIPRKLIYQPALHKYEESHIQILMRQNIQLYFESWLKKFPRHLQRIQKKDFIAPGNHNKGGCASFVHLVTVSQRMSLKPILLSSLERNRTSFFFEGQAICVLGARVLLPLLYFTILSLIDFLAETTDNLKGLERTAEERTQQDTY